jgi:hypothetical protein
MGDKTMKNWTHLDVPGGPPVYIDNYNNLLSYYVPYGGSEVSFGECHKIEPKKCFDLNKRANFCIKSFFHPSIRNGISVAVTSPTVFMGGYGYGVADIRVKNNVLTQWMNMNALSPDMNTYHNILNRTPLPKLGEYYFMMLYQLDADKFTETGGDEEIQIVKVSPPYLTMPLSNEVIPYDVNFPTGLCYKDEHFYITFGCGDCLFYCQKIHENSLIESLIFADVGTIGSNHFTIWKNALWDIDKDHFISNVCQQLNIFKTTAIQPIFDIYNTCAPSRGPRFSTRL